MSRLADALGPGPAPVTACGLEHEYRVRDGGDLIDFRGIIGRLGLDGAGLDPADPLAHRGAWGGAITADGAEAEVATPPTPVAPGFTGRVAWWAARGREELAAALPAGAELEGYSTHLSVSVPGPAVAPVARAVTERFAPAVMLLLDRSDSPGMLVRPRHGRVELCGEYATGEHLRAAAAMAVGATLACRSQRRPLPAIRCRVEPARIRRGWYVDRAAFGSDLYRGGRDAVLHLEDGRTVRAGEHLRRCWEVARAELDGIAAPEDLAAADAVVEGALPLPVEDPTPCPTPPELVVAGDTPFARLGLGRRPGLDVRPAAVQWHGVAFEVAGAGATRYVWVPEPWLESFLFELVGGGLDEPLAAALAGPLPRRSLASSVGSSSGGDPAVYGSLGDTKKLALGEPDPLTGRSGGGGLLGGRPSKDAAESKALGRIRLRQGLVGAGIGAALAFVVVPALGL